MPYKLLHYVLVLCVSILTACGAPPHTPLDGTNTDKTFIDTAECIKDQVRMNTGSGSLNMGPETAIAYYSDEAKVVVRDVNSFDTIATIVVEKRENGSNINPIDFGYNTDAFGAHARNIELAVDHCR